VTARGNDDERKLVFVRALAHYLVGDQASMSIRLQMGDPNAEQWSSLCGATPLFGYPSEDEAVEQFASWLGVGWGSTKPKKARARS